MNDMMPVYLIGKIHVPGWDELSAQDNNVAVTLQAMANLEVKWLVDGDNIPTQMSILEEAIRLGSNLSPTSQKVIHENIHRLIDLGHVWKIDSNKGRMKKRARGGPTSPWKTVYVSKYIRLAIENQKKLNRNGRK